eukprot:Rmarinus@m.16585
MDETPGSKIKNCRFYENKYPEVDEVVVVQVKSIEEMGAYVRLLEYNDIEGMIQLSELSRRRIRSIQKLIRVGRQETVMVLRVDKEKGYIDLSKRRVAAEDIPVAKDRFDKAKVVHSIMRHVASIHSLDLEELYQNFCWPVYKIYGHAFDGFKVAVADPEKFFASLPPLDPEVKESLMKDISRRLMPQPYKIRADIEVTCFHDEGIETIKAALKAGETCGTEETPIKISLYAPPLYLMTTTDIDKPRGLKVLNAAVEVVKEELTKRNGEILVKNQPRVVGEREEEELADLYQRLQRQNREISGDDDDEDEEGDPLMDFETGEGGGGGGGGGSGDGDEADE